MQHPVNETSDKLELLQALKIDRTPPAPSRRAYFRGLIVLAGLGCAVLLVLFFFPFSANKPAVIAVESTSESSPARVPTPVESPQASVALNATGYVVARQIATVSARVTGKVEAIFVEEGSYVQAEELLARLNDDLARAELRLAESQLDSARAGLDELHAILKQSRLNFSRLDTLRQRNLSSVSQTDAARLEVEVAEARLALRREDIAIAESRVELQRQKLRDMEIRAPFSGVIIAKAAQPGEIISPISAGGGFTRTGIGTLVDMESLEVEVDVSEANLKQVAKGQGANVVLNAYPDLTLPAEVITIVPTANRNRATVKVRIAFLRKDPRILPDMGVKVFFLEASETPAATNQAESAESSQSVTQPRS